MGLIPLEEEYWRRGLKIATPYRLNMIDLLFHLGKFINSCKILFIFRGEGVYIIKDILLTYFISSICLFLWFPYFVCVVINIIVIIVVTVVAQGCCNISFVATILQWCYSSPLRPVCMLFCFFFFVYRDCIFYVTVLLFIFNCSFHPLHVHVCYNVRIRK